MAWMVLVFRPGKSDKRNFTATSLNEDWLPRVSTTAFVGDVKVDVELARAVPAVKDNCGKMLTASFKGNIKLECIPMYCCKSNQ